MVGRIECLPLGCGRHGGSRDPAHGLPIASPRFATSLRLLQSHRSGGLLCQTVRAERGHRDPGRRDSSSALQRRDGSRSVAVARLAHRSGQAAAHSAHEDVLVRSRRVQKDSPMHDARDADNACHARAPPLAGDRAGLAGAYDEPATGQLDTADVDYASRALTQIPQANNVCDLAAWWLPPLRANAAYRLSARNSGLPSPKHRESERDELDRLLLSVS